MQDGSTPLEHPLQPDRGALQIQNPQIYSLKPNAMSLLGSCSLLTKWPFSGSSLFLVLIAFCRYNLQTPHTDARFGLRDTIVCGNATNDFSLDPGERKWMFVLSLLGIFGNVIPKYLKDDGAKRHVAQMKANSSLLIHIIAGVATIIGNGLVGLNGGFSGRGILFWSVVFWDFIHQLSIILLLKNHDGIYALRVGNFTAIILKFTALLNHRKHGAYISDVFFAASFGFMGTRLGTLLFYVICSVSGYKGGLKYEHYYSLGLAFSQFHLFARLPHVEVTALSMLPVVGWLYYHELWRNEFKTHFFVFNCMFAGVSLVFFDTSTARYLALFLYYAMTFAMPRFHRNPGIALQGKKLVTSKEKSMLLDREEAMFEDDDKHKHPPSLPLKATQSLKRGLRLFNETQARL